MHAGFPQPRSSIVVFLCAVLVCAQGCTFSYLVHLGIGQAKIITGRKPIEEVIADPSIRQEAKNKLELILEAKAYAEKEIGLAPSSAYTRYYEVTGPVVAYNLTASPRLELKAHRWCFPIVGCIPYKGFFSLDRAQKEQEEMGGKGFDTYLRGVSAYSTLGWFIDPVFSTMLSYDEATLVEITIHEMVHRTIFLKHKVEFNEGIATFIGQQGALEFLGSRYGPDASPSAWARDRMADDRVFQEFIVRVKDRLTSLYSSPLPDAEKLAQKGALFKEAMKEYQGLVSQFHTGGYNRVLRMEWNNALIVSFLTYVQDLRVYEQVFEKMGRDLKRMVEFCKGLENEDAIEERIQLMLSSQ